jgi:hypothetical protein
MIIYRINSVITCLSFSYLVSFIEYLIDILLLSSLFTGPYLKRRRKLRMDKKNKDFKMVVPETLAGSLIVIGEKRGVERREREQARNDLYSKK